MSMETRLMTIKDLTCHAFHIFNVVYYSKETKQNKKNYVYVCVCTYMYGTNWEKRERVLISCSTCAHSAILLSLTVDQSLSDWHFCSSDENSGPPRTFRIETPTSEADG